MEERICTIPLKDAFEHVRQKRAARAVKIVRAYVARHMKVDGENVRISAGVNSAILEHGIQKPPRRIKVKLVLDDKGIATAWMTEEQAKLEVQKKKLEEKKKVSEERAKKAAEAKAKKEKPAAKAEAKPVAPVMKAEAKPAQATPAKAESKPAAPAEQKPASAAPATKQ